MTCLLKLTHFIHLSQNLCFKMYYFYINYLFIHKLYYFKT